jgi:hypothetical protein
MTNVQLMNLHAAGDWNFLVWNPLLTTRTVMSLSWNVIALKRRMVTKII